MKPMVMAGMVGSGLLLILIGLYFQHLNEAVTKWTSGQANITDVRYDSSYDDDDHKWSYSAHIEYTYQYEERPIRASAATSGSATA